MKFKPKAIVVSAIAAVSLMGCGKEAPPQRAAVIPGSPAELATKSGCLACHRADTKLVGPAYRDVAKKYTAADEAKLFDKVRKGGGGVWGPIPMPPNLAVKDDDLHTLIKWILAGAK